MATHFREAAQRHYGDATRLLNQGRLGGADHLYGLSAECALKAILVGLRVIPPDGPPPMSRYRKHIDQLWAQFAIYMRGPGGAAYSLPAQSPFDDWAVEQRYDGDATFTSSRVQAHQAGATTAGRLMEQAILNGDLA